jgi:hypothetical protein
MTKTWLLRSPVRRKSGFLALTILSAATLCGGRLEFDTSRFESWHPSQPPGSLAEIPRHSENRRHFRGLATKSPVSGEGYRTFRTKRREFRGKSLLDEFSISEIQGRYVARPVAFWRTACHSPACCDSDCAAPASTCAVTGPAAKRAASIQTVSRIAQSLHGSEAVDLLGRTVLE